MAKRIGVSDYRKLLRKCYKISRRYVGKEIDTILISALADDISLKTKVAKDRLIFAMTGGVLPSGKLSREDAISLSIKISSYLIDLGPGFSFGRIISCEPCDNKLEIKIFEFYKNPWLTSTSIAIPKYSIFTDGYRWFGIPYTDNIPLLRDMDCLIGLYTTLQNGRIVTLQDERIMKWNRDLLYSRIGYNSRGKPFQCLYCKEVHTPYNSVCSNIIRLRNTVYCLEDFLSGG